MDNEEIKEEKQKKEEKVQLKEEKAVESIAKIEEKSIDNERWIPKTDIGKKVKSGEITDLSLIINSGLKILEVEIVDSLLNKLELDLIAFGQSKGKFGGGKRSIWKQTQKKTKEGNKPKFSTMVIVGNRDGYVGLGRGKAKETMPAREKATRNAKLNIINIKRGCGSWECGCREGHSIPFKVIGKCGSVKVELMPAPKGSGLVVENECKKILVLAGIKDVYSKTFGQIGTKVNLAQACFDALKQLAKTKVREEDIGKLGII